MDNIRDMTIMEVNVLNTILHSASYDLPIQSRELRQTFKLSKRKLEEIIENLRVTYKQPIVAKKRQPSGYYLPKTEQERKDGLAPYERQILTEQKNLAAIMSVNLDEYWKNAKKPDGNQAQNK